MSTTPTAHPVASAAIAAQAAGKQKFPYWRYKAKYPDPAEETPELESFLVTNEEEAKEIEKAGGWVESPADVGIETAPGAAPDPAIAAKQKPPAKPPKK
jgi:hypothetical protein